jgi:hypothetical protein
MFLFQHISSWLCVEIKTSHSIKWNSSLSVWSSQQPVYFYSLFFLFCSMNGFNIHCLSAETGVTWSDFYAWELRLYICCIWLLLILMEALLSRMVSEVEHVNNDKKNHWTILMWSKRLFKVSLRLYSYDISWR